jgi:hypothetical protein
MAKNLKTENDWINSILKRQNLLQPEEENIVDLKPCWAQIEECQIVERMGQFVADINAAAGYCILELQDFLPPQKTILSITFSKRFAEYVLEMVVCEDGAATVVFYSLSKISELWERHFRNLSQLRDASISFSLDIHPAEVLNDDLQRWFSYLLSGFKNKLKPNVAQQLAEKEYG